MSIQSKTDRPVALTDGLTRNTLFNTMGLIWSVLLVFAATPYIIQGLTVEGYGIFGIVALVAGYAGVFSGPMATGSVRFMAQAYARQEWSEFKEAAVAGVLLSGGFAFVGAMLILLAANSLPDLFKVTDDMTTQATTALQIAAVAFFFSSIASALQSIPAAIRRYDILNGAKIALDTLRVFGILFAIWLGRGLIGAVTAQLFVSILAVVLFFWIARFYLQQLTSGNSKRDLMDHQKRPLRQAQCVALPHVEKQSGNITSLRRSIGQLFSFSVALLVQHTSSMMARQLDRTVIGIFLGPSSLTFYSVPLQISDRVPMLIGSMTTALYPLSSEAVGNEQLAELQRLYLRYVQLLTWLSAFIATLIVPLAQDLLFVWVGPEFASNSWFVLATLAVAAVWRTPSTVAYQVYNGLGRGDIGVGFSLLYLFCLIVTVPLLTQWWGINGTALAILITTIPIALYADILTQRKLLGQTDWSLSLLPYLKPWLVGSMLVLGLSMMPDMGSWLNLVIKGICVFFGFLSGIFFLDRVLFWSIWTKVQKLGHRIVKFLK